MRDAAGSTETVRTHQDEMRRLAIAAQHCLTPDAGRKPKGLNTEQALLHLESIHEHAVAALDLLNNAINYQSLTGEITPNKIIPDPFPALRGDAE